MDDETDAEPAATRQSPPKIMNGLEEWSEHFTPATVNTCNVPEEILEVSSGLYHFVLRTESGVFTWGKNIEKQLGNDASRQDVIVPTLVEGLKQPQAIDCGADFTLVRLANDSVYAFGNNNQGQCGRDTSEKSAAMMGKWVRLKISKRHIRIPDGSACVSAPTEIVFPEPPPSPSCNGDRVSPTKGLPLFRSKFFSRSNYLDRFHDDPVNELSLDLMTLNARRHSDYSEGATSPDDEPEQRRPSIDVEEDGRLGEEGDIPLENGLPTPTITAQFVHYCLYLFHGIYDNDLVAQSCESVEFRVRLKMLDSRFFEAFQLAVESLKRDDGEGTATEAVKSQQALILFEFFTKDENLIPMHEEDLKFFIQAMFVLFIENGWQLEPLERYLLANLNLYIMPLAYVLFFDETHHQQKDDKDILAGSDNMSESVDSVSAESASNSRQLRESVLHKYRTFFGHLEKSAAKYRIRGSEKIFERISVRFNAIICQRVIETFNQIDND